jgi:hypothetical protein
MFVVGGFHILLAMSEFARVAWVPSSLGTVPIIQALVFWGIIDLIIGFIALYAGASILRGGMFGWVVGYTFAALGIIRWLFYIPLSPVLAVVIIVLDVLIIYGLAKHSDYSQAIWCVSGFVEQGARGTQEQTRLRRAVLRVARFASFAGLSVLTAVDGIDPLAVLFGIGALVVGRRLLDRRGNERRELNRQIRANATWLGRVAREDRIATQQMKRLAALQEGVEEGFELLPEEHGLLLFEGLRAVVDEVEVSALLARPRSALRRHLAAVKRRAVMGRIRGLEEEIEKIGEGSTLRASFEAALESRRGELATYDEIPQAIGLINAQPEGIDRRGIAERKGNPPPSSLGSKLLIQQPRVLALVKNDAFASCAHSGGRTTL